MRFGKDRWIHSTSVRNPAQLDYDRTTRTFRLLIKHRTKPGRQAIPLTTAQLAATVNVGSEALSTLALENT